MSRRLSSNVCSNVQRSFGNFARGEQRALAKGGGWKGAASSRILFPSPPPQPRTARASCVRPGIAFPEFLTRCDPTSRGIERRREREGEGVEQLACRVRHNNERGESARKKLRNEGIEADERVTVGSKTLITRVNYPLIV